MAYAPDLSHIFTDGYTLRLKSEDALHSECRLQVKQIAELTVTTGLITACDPVTMWGAHSPFNRGVGHGRYPVLLTMAHYIGGEQCEAFASVQFRPEEPVSWEMAVTPWQDARGLVGKGFHGYGVNSGRGCFMDAQAVPIMKSRAKARDMDRKFDPTGFDTGSMVLEEESGLNVVNFNSGAGNGIYPSFWGFNDKYRIVCLTTDFCLLPDEDSQEAYA